MPDRLLLLALTNLERIRQFRSDLDGEALHVPITVLWRPFSSPFPGSDPPREQRTSLSAGRPRQTSAGDQLTSDAVATASHPAPADNALLRSAQHRLPRNPHSLQALVDTYDGNTYRLLADLADFLGASVAYVDRPTVEGHLERTLSNQEWAAVAEQLSAMALDEHVGEAGSFRSDWIEDVLARADVSGRNQSENARPANASHRRET